MIKMEVDYSSTVEEKIPECEKLAKVSWASIAGVDFGLVNLRLQCYPNVYYDYRRLTSG